MLDIDLTINYTIASYTITIFNKTTSVPSYSSTTISLTETVPSDQVEEYATFSITVIDANGLPNKITQDDLTSPDNNVFVDTISPTVTLKANTTTIPVNDPLPSIIATMKDGDRLNYGTNGDGIIETMINESIVNASVNNKIVGAYAFTYYALDDAAGNPGQSDTISIVVKNDIQNATTVLNSSVIADAPQSFSDDIIIAEIHNDDGDSNNTLSLDAPTVHLDVSDITIDASGTNNRITTYTHPLDLSHNRISAQIESGTVLTFTANDSIKDAFTIRHDTDEYNDDIIQLGHDDVNYILTSGAIGVTFDRVSSSFKVYIRDNSNADYTEIVRYPGIVTNGTNASAIIKGNSSLDDVLYTFDGSTVTVWTLHLSEIKGNGTSSGGGDESDSNSPTLGKASSGAQLVTNGFEYNGLTVNVGRYHTEFPLIGTNVGDINTIKRMRICRNTSCLYQMHRL